VLQHSACLCDIRFSPHSRNPVYTQAQLRARFKTRYVHVPALGNRNYRGGPIHIVDYPHGVPAIAALLEAWEAVILLCVCADVQRCHRQGVGERLSLDLGHRCIHHTFARQGQPAPQLVLPF
jgi:hypothetical protein